MLKNYFIITVRNLLKHKGYSLINVLGLAIGLATCIFILLYIQDELSYDRHHEHADDIYRVAVEGNIMGNPLDMVVTSYPMGRVMVTEYPEVINYVRFMPNNNMLIRYEDKVFNERRFLWADSTIFDVFSVPVLLGDKKTALNKPHTIAMSRSTAEKYFGTIDNAIDKVVKFEDGTEYTVTAVVEDCPQNSHFYYDVLASFITIEDGSAEFWLQHNNFTYILLRQGTDYKRLETQMQELVTKYVGPQLETAMGASYDQFLESGGSFGYVLQPLVNIHLHSHKDYELEANGNILYVYIFGIVAIFILVIASINFMNLATARATSRAREVGIRKVLGSNLKQLVSQFLTESTLLSFIALILALVIVGLLMPSFNNLAGKEISTDILLEPTIIIAMIALTLIVGFFAGSYPAFFISAFQPIEVLHGKLRGGLKGGLLRSGLVVFQFVISIVLFISTFVVYNQLSYIQDKNLGYDKEHLLVIRGAWSLDDNQQAFKDQLLSNPAIVSASGASRMPGGSYGNTVMKLQNTPAEQQFPINLQNVDYDYIHTMQMEMVKGRFFDRGFPADTSAVVINERAAQLLGISEDPLNQTLVVVGPNPELNQYFTIIGVQKDFHYQSLHHPIGPMATFLDIGQTGVMAVRMSPENVSQTVAFIKETWGQFVKDRPFEYEFYDEYYDQLYRAEQTVGTLFTTFSALAIFIACLGLFGLAAFTAAKRAKEISIRKVLGASVSTVVILLSKEFTILVLIANIIAWPLSYFIMQSWIENFAYQVNIGFTVFIVAALLAFLIAWITVSFQAIKAALTNPVNILNTE